MFVFIDSNFSIEYENIENSFSLRAMLLTVILFESILNEIDVIRISVFIYEEKERKLIQANCCRYLF